MRDLERLFRGEGKRPEVFRRVRAFMLSADLMRRRVTAEWLAGRLTLPLADCEQALEVV